MKILIACEFSGTVRDAFLTLGHEAWSCDLLPTEKPGPHIQGDVRDFLGSCQANNFKHWDLMIAFPPCTYLCSSGLHWNKKVSGRQAKTDEAIKFITLLLNAPIDKIALENPIGCISSRIRKPNQIIQPWQFGHDASKATCLWLENLPKLKYTNLVEPRIINGKPRWENQTDSGQNRLGPSIDRWALRSLTYPGIAKAMAEQWGNLT